MNYYNEFEPFAAQWLRNLEAAGHVAAGTVDERSILEVTPNDVSNATQAHFFAGIGIWSHALRCAGWPDDAAVWTGSCPCQPFSVAGKGDGFLDVRHLWPVWFGLIRECHPPVIFGEQVASPGGLEWFDSVCADLEGAGYAVGAADTCAAGFGAPHIRQRLYFVAIRLADAGETGRELFGGAARLHEDGTPRHDTARRSEAGWLGHADGERAGRDAGTGAGAEGGPRLRPVGDESRAPGAARGLGDAIGEGLEGHAGDGDDGAQPRRLDADAARPASTASGADWEWLPCRDGKWRPTQPGLRPLAHVSASRVGRLRAYGNGLCASQATGFVRAVMQTLGMEAT